MNYLKSKICNLIFLIYLGFFPELSSAEKQDSSYREASFIGRTKTALFTSNDAKHYVQDFLDLDGFEMVLQDSTSSLTGNHYLFNLRKNTIPIWNAHIKINTLYSGELSSLFYKIPNKSIVDEQITQNTDSLIYYPLLDGFSLCQRVLIQKEDLSLERIYFNDSLVYERDLNIYFSDSLARFQVFNPDPLSTAQVNYASPYSDQNDADVFELNAERILVEMPVHFDTGLFSLQNEYVRIIELSAPVINPVTRTDPDFIYTRTESGFEDVMAYYHISVFQLYIQSLGFTNLVNYAIDVDTHGNNGQDNSFFNPTFSPPRMVFGEGGVDDAEDADVIIHEYGHAISHSAAPGTNIGTQRQAMDEALGDYLAASYSKTLSMFRYEDVFTWDGHNEFWDGRNVETNKTYPSSLTNNFYEDSELWSSTLMDINEAIGRAQADQIIFESWHQFSSNLTYVEAAILLLQADTLLNNGLYSDQICSILDARGLYSCVPNSVKQIHSNDIISLHSSDFFAKGGNAWFSIKSSAPVRVDLVDVFGRVVQSYEANNTNPEKIIAIDGQNMPLGLYIASVSINDQAVQSYVLVKVE